MGPPSVAEQSSNGGSSIQNSVDLVRAPGQDDDGFDESKAVTNGLFGVLYTVSKEHDRIPWAMAAFRLFMDWLQLFLLTVNPAYGYDMNPDSLGWKIFNFVQLNQFMQERGYTFFLGCMYTMVVALGANLGISVWVGYSFQNNRFDHVWPIVFLRWFADIFYQVLDIASITLFLMVFDCNYFDRPAEVTYYNQEFTDTYCWSMPHLIHVVVAGFSLLAFVSMAALYTMAQMELNPLTQNIMAMGHSKVELQSFAIRAIMTFSSVFITGTRWLSIVQLAMSALLVYLYTRWLPHYYEAVNHIRVATYTGIFFTAIIFVLMAFTPYIDTDDADAVKSYRDKLTILCWALVGPAMLLGGAVSWLRVRHFKAKVLPRFSESLTQPDAFPEDIYEVTDARQVEILARCTRKWVDKRTLDEEAVTLGEAVLKCGLAQRPKDPYMVLLYSSFLIDVLSSYQSGYTLLQSAKKCDPSLLMRFAIFSREQQHTQKAAGNGGQGTDLVSYVEFQKNYGLAIKCHKEALLAIRAFWATLLHANVKFTAVAGAVKRMDKAIRAADRVYKMVLQRHTNHVKMVQLYAKFLQHVKNDPWGAAKWFAEAEKLEQAEEDAKSNNVFGGMEVDPALRQALLTTHDDRAIVIVDAQGVIQMTNQTCHEMFGYTKTELRGKNVSVLIPPPFSEHHTAYIRSYVQTGQETMLNRNVLQVALHKDRRVLTIRLQTAKLSGIGEDSVFIGVMQLIQPEADTAVIHVLHNGQILSADDTFSDWTGFKASDLAGGAATSLLVQGKQLEELLRQARNASIRAAADMRNSTLDESALGGVYGPTAGSTTAKIALGGGAVGSSYHRAGSSVVSAGRSITNRHGGGVAHAGASAPSITVKGPSRSIIGMLGVGGAAAGDEIAEGGSSEPELQLAASWSLARSLVNHKYSDPVRMDVGVCNGGIGAMQFYALTLKRSALPLPQPPSSHPDSSGGGPPRSPAGGRQAYPTAPGSFMPGLGQGLVRGGISSMPSLMMQSRGRHMAPPASQDYLLVSTPSGAVVHATSALAALLGSTPKALMGNGAPNVLSGLMPEPFATMHRQLAKSLPISRPPPWSCRSGLAVLLSVSREASAGMGLPDTPALPFRLGLKKRSGLDDTYHVATLEPLTLQQALEERCMTLLLNHAGVVKSVSATPATTFGFDPQTLVGKSVADFVDVFQEVADEDTVLGAATPSVPRLLSLMLAGCNARPGLGWRVGMVAPVDEVEAMAMGEDYVMASALMGRGEQPAVMTLRARMAHGRHHHQYSNLGAPTASAAQPNQQPPGSSSGGEQLEIQVQLWPAPLVTSVLELDSAGRVVSEQEAPTARTALYPPGLVLGLAPSAMQGHHIRKFLPLGEKGVADLFRPSAFGAELNHLLTRGDSILREAPKAGAMKGAKAGAHEDRRVGPPQAVRLQHPADGEEYLVMVQAVRRSDHSHGTFLVMRPLQPRCGRPGLKALLEARAALTMAAAGPVARLSTHSVALTSRGFHKDSALSHQSHLARASLRHSSEALPPVRVDEQIDGSRSFRPTDSAAGSRFQPQTTGSFRPGGMPSRMATPPSANVIQVHPEPEPASLDPDNDDPAAALQPLLPPPAQDSSLLGQLLESQQGGGSTRAGAVAGVVVMGDDGGDIAPLLTADADATDSANANAMTSLATDTANEHAALQGRRLLDPVPSGLSGSDSALHRKGTSATGRRQKPGAAGNAKEASITAWVNSDGAEYPMVDPAMLAAMVEHQAPGQGQGQGQAHSVKALPATPPPKHDPARPFTPGSEGGRIAGAGSSSAGSHSEGGHSRRDGDGSSDGGKDADEGPSGDLGTDGEGGELDGELDEEASYKRGQRFKKLTRLLTSPQMQKPTRRYKLHVGFLLALLLVVHTAIFVLMMVMIQTQIESVLDLNNIGQAARYASRLAINTRALNVHYSNATVPGLRLLSGPEDLPKLMEEYQSFIAEFERLHSGSYLGFGAKRRLPDVGRLRDLWETPMLDEVVYANIPFNESLGNNSVMEQSVETTKVSLWDAGNLMVAKAVIILLTSQAEYYGPNKTSQLPFDSDPNLLYIVTNYANSVIKGYLMTMDDMVQHVIDSAFGINDMQVYVLIVEGCVLCVIFLTYVWLLVQKVARHRYSMYLVFMSVPQTLLRTLATKRMNLTDDGDDDDDDLAGGLLPQQQQQTVASGTVPQAAPSAEQAASKQGPSKHKQSVTFGGGKSAAVAPADPEQGAPAARNSSSQLNTWGTPLGSGRLAPPASGSGLFSALAFWRSKSVRVAPSTKRHLQPSLWPSLWLSWPFLLWGIVIVVCNVVAHELLGKVDGPIALFNIVNRVAVLNQRNNFFLQEMTFEPYLAEREYQRTVSSAVIEELRREYSVMLYGNEAVANDSTYYEQYKLVREGVIYSTDAGSYILFDTRECLCESPSDCMDPSDPLYGYVRHGLHRMMERYLELGTSIKRYQYMDPALSGPLYRYFWNTRPHIAGGLTLLNTAYSDHVKAVYNQILSLHIIAFVLTWAIVICYVFFIMRPFLKQTSNEARRIAELLSQLPFELDIETLLARNLLLGGSSKAAGMAPTGPGAGALPGQLGGASLMNRNPSMSRDGSVNSDLAGGTGLKVKRL